MSVAPSRTLSRLLIVALHPPHFKLSTVIVRRWFMMGLLQFLGWALPTLFTPVGAKPIPKGSASLETPGSN